MSARACGSLPSTPARPPVRAGMEPSTGASAPGTTGSGPTGRPGSSSETLSAGHSPAGHAGEGLGRSGRQSEGSRSKRAGGGSPKDQRRASRGQPREKAVAQGWRSNTEGRRRERLQHRNQKGGVRKRPKSSRTFGARWLGCAGAALRSALGGRLAETGPRCQALSKAGAAGREGRRQQSATGDGLRRGQKGEGPSGDLPKWRTAACQGDVASPKQENYLVQRCPP